MNELKLDIEKKLDGAETSREQYTKLNNTKKIFNFSMSPKNKNIKSINYGKNNSCFSPKNINKENSTDKVIIENLKNAQKKHINDLINSNDSSCNSFKKYKPLKRLELQEKDISNFIEFKSKKEPNKDLLFRKGVVLNNNIQSVLFNNKCINKNFINNKLNLMNNVDNINKGSEVNNIDKVSAIENTPKPLIIKLDPKKGTSCLNNQKKNSEIINIKNNIKDLSPRAIAFESSAKIKTPNKKLFIDNNSSKAKESLSDIINIYKNDITIKGNKKMNKIINKSTKLVPEENHFKAVLYSQEIKKYNSSLA